jgi:DNA replication initiation complex subunit (GINS family)
MILNGGMAEENLVITYESLFDLLSREKKREDLQRLDDEFIQNLIHYIQSKEQMVMVSSGDMFSSDNEITKIQLRNIKKIVKELFERRQKKILQMALYSIKVSGSLIDLTTMIQDEKILYQDLQKLFQGFNDHVIQKIMVAQNPTMSAHSALTTASEYPEQKESNVSENDVTLRFLHAVPKFMGREEKTYGPFEEEEIALLPNYVAQILISKGRAERMNFKNS